MEERQGQMGKHYAAVNISGDRANLSRPGIPGPIQPHLASPDPCPNPTSYPAPATWSCMSSHHCWSAPNGPQVQPDATRPHPHGHSDVQPPLANLILGPWWPPDPCRHSAYWAPMVQPCHAASITPCCCTVHHSVPTLAKM